MVSFDLLSVAAAVATLLILCFMAFRGVTSRWILQSLKRSFAEGGVEVVDACILNGGALRAVPFRSFKKFLDALKKKRPSTVFFFTFENGDAFTVQFISQGELFTFMGTRWGEKW